MNYNSNTSDTDAGILKYSCAVMFMLFAFCYIFFLQGEILSEAQFVYSKGLTTYHNVGSALVITFVLQILQWTFNTLIHMPSKWHACSYFPSFLALAMLTDIDEGTIANFSFGAWLWVLPLLLIAFAIFVFAMKRINAAQYSNESSPLATVLCRNYIILLVLFLVTGSVAKTSDVYHYELKTERLIQQGKYEEASKVGIRSLKTSKRLTELRMYALAKQDLLGENIFDYPHYYGSRGLLDVCDTSHVHRITATDICFSMGAVCGKSIKMTDTYLGIMVNVDSLRNKTAIDYYLCNLLLKKDLDDFEFEVYKYYDPQKVRLPKAYQEALVFKSIEENDSLEFIEPEIYENYKKYKLLKLENFDTRVKSNRTRREFGNTYWWYYEFQNTGEKIVKKSTDKFGIKERAKKAKNKKKKMQNRK